MEIKQEAVAGTLESSDMMVTVTPGSGGIKIELDSSVEKYYGDSIRQTMHQVLEELGVSNVQVHALDHGALDCTIRARLTTALRRAAAEQEAEK
ncbi:MAG: citrate lyase acyl carrier protein [Oscillibacter sp.]